VLEPGDTAPLDATVWPLSAEPTKLRDLLADGPVLLLFYLYDWTGT
jgi:hypothetical protein